MGFGVFLLMLRMILLCFLAYFGAASGCIRLYETMTFYVPFSRELVSGGVYNNTTHRKLMRAHATPIVGVLLVSLVLVVLLVIFTPAGFWAAIVCFVAGVIIYFRGRRPKKNMIRLFVHRYRRHMDESHLDALLQKRYNMSLDELSPHSKQHTA